MRIDDVAAYPGCSCERRDRWRGRWVVLKGAKSFAEAGIGIGPSAPLRGG